MITGMPRIAIAAHNFDAVVGTFRDKFDMPVVDLSAATVGSLGAKLAMCVPEGGSNIELMCPANPQMPLSQSLERFLARRGEGLFALMLEAADPNAEAERLAGAGLAVLPLMAGAGGRDIHPKSTHGVLIRIYPNGSFQGQAPHADDRLGLSGIVRVMIAVNDLAEARVTYGDKLGLPVDETEVRPAAGVRTAICRPPNGGVIELVSAHDAQKPLGGLVRAFLAERGEGLFALVLEAGNLERVAMELVSRGLTVGRHLDDMLEVGPADTFGARILVTRRGAGA